MSKDFGPVSGYLDPANKSWEQITWRTGRPILDKELNLAGEMFYQPQRKSTLCSGFLFSRDFYSPDIYPVDSTYLDEPGNFRQEIGTGITNNRFYFGPCQRINVSDMILDLKPSASDWIPVDLSAAPLGVGVKRWDLVFIEVWRGAVTGSAATDITLGTRDSNGKIFYNGWADSPTADNFVDDVLDGGVGVETSRRVQLQWRIRSVSNVDMYAYPDGLDDTTNVFAQGPGSVVSAISFTSQASVGDPGLWVSTGHASTIDGNIYAIPVCAVARRNQSAWDQDTNQNGGSGTGPIVASYTDILEFDFLDLRKTVSDHWDLETLLKKNLSWLMDGRLKTDFEETGLGGGLYGTYFTQIDEVTTIDTPGATRIGEPDSYRKHFSDADTENFVYQTIILGDRILSTSLTVWKVGDTFELTLPVSSDGVFVRVLEMGLLSGYGTTQYTVTGYNTKTLTFTLTSLFESSIVVGGRTSTDIFVKVVVSYAGGFGLSRTPYFYQTEIETGASFTTLEAGDNFVWETAPPAGIDTTGLDTDSLLYKPSRTATLIPNFINTDFSVYSRSTTTTVISDEIRSVQGIYDGVADPGKLTNLYLGITSDNIIQHSAVPATHRLMIIDYTSKKPIPSGSKILLYYRTAAQQSLNINVAGLNVSIVKLHMLYAPDWLYTSSSGSGNHLPGYPYVSPMAQIPISDLSLDRDDHILNYGQTINVDSFGTSAQLIQLSVKVPMAFIPYFCFENPDQDDEFRNFYTDVQTTTYDDIINGSPSIYQPSVFAQRLQNNIPHKVIYPCIALCIEDTKIGKRGTLVLLIFTRTSTDDQNAIIFDSAVGGDSCVAIYRLKGNPIISPRKSQLGSSLI